MKRIKLALDIDVFDEKDIKKYEAVAKTQPTFHTNNGEIIITFGAPTYDWEIAEFLKTTSKEEIDTLKKLAKLKHLKNQVAELEKEIAD